MKHFIFVIVILCVSTPTFAQVEIGLQVSPVISSNRVELESESKEFSLHKDGSKFVFKLGVVADFPFAHNYYFSTGLFYVPKRVALKRVERATQATLSEEYDLQYLQIPLAVKLYTDAITLDTRLFFDVGVNPEIAISEKFDKKNILIEDFKFFDITLVLGIGVEYKIGVNNAIYVAIVYNRGLINPIGKSIDIGEDILLKNDLIGLDLGIKL